LIRELPPFKQLLKRLHVARLKIDYYDGSLEFGSDDPADASVTTRVITILLPEDY
jgi:hypothetical protein